jgi:hypothetical protein
MRAGTPAGDAEDFPAIAARVLADTAQQLGLDCRDARLIRVFGTAVYYLPRVAAVARIAQVTSPESVTRLGTSVLITRWLVEHGFPAVEPLPVEQPVTSQGCAATFWRYLPQNGPAPEAADLGNLLCRLHRLGRPPHPLTTYKPLTSVRKAIGESRAISDEEQSWLASRCDRLTDAYASLRFELPAGLIHGDAWRGNLLRDGRRVVLGDWDNVSTGPREIDLVPTLQAPRFGMPADERDAFIAAYGRDIRTWDGYPVLHAMRELSTLTALLRDGHTNMAAQKQLTVRLRSIRTGDDQVWESFG